MEQFDIAVVGGGPSGFAAAMRAVDLGKRTILIEKNRLGGAGVFNGALSSKTLWELSRRYQLVHSGVKAFRVYDSEVDFASVCSEMNLATNEKYTQLISQVNALVKSDKLSFVQGTASFQDPNTLGISHQGNPLPSVWAEKIILATGSRPRYLDHIPIDEKTVFTSDGVSGLSDFPDSLVILGAGVIGCEFATIFSNFQRTKVYLIDKEERILPFEDEDVAAAVAGNLEKNGVTIHRGSQLKRLDVVDGRVEYELEFKDGRTEIYNVEKALISVGRVPNTENLNLKAAGVALTDRGHIPDNDSCTNVSHIYAVGDITADIALVNVAELEGRHAVELACGMPSPRMSYLNISTIMFLNPEVAAVGLNELEARRKKWAYRAASIRYNYINRAIAMRRTQGMIKLLVSDDDQMRILGMRVVGAHASSTIQAVSLLIHMNKGIHELAEVVHAHPSMPEGVQECARMLLGKSIIKPELMGHAVNCYRVNEQGRMEHFNNLAVSSVPM